MNWGYHVHWCLVWRLQRCCSGLTQGGPQSLWIQLWWRGLGRGQLFLGTHSTFYPRPLFVLCSTPHSCPWLEDPPNYSIFPSLLSTEQTNSLGALRNAVPPSSSLLCHMLLSGAGAGGGSGHLRGSARGPRPCSQRSEHGSAAQPDHSGALRGSPSSPPRTWPSDLLEMGAPPWAPGLLRAPEV